MDQATVAKHAANIADPTVWANAGGLIGLIIMALFVALMVFIWAIWKIVDKNNLQTREILNMHIDERKQWATVIDGNQRETNDSIKAMTSVLSEINSRSRRYDNN